MTSIIKKPKSYSYIRFSSELQAKGDSIRRQTNLALEYAEKNDLALVPENIMRDEGLSGFKGEHINGGALGGFMRAIEAGKIEKGSYLLVESHDRLSRMEPDVALAQFLNITNAGIVVVTLEDGMVFQKPVNTFQLMASIVKMGLANEESAKKKFRHEENWKRKRAIASDTKMTATAPRWLMLNPDRKGFTIIEDRATIVRRIFNMSLNGHGAYVITNTLNKENIRSFGRAGHWQLSSVKSILTNKAVYGEFQPHKRDENNRRVPVGDPIKDYYPEIVTEADFYANASTMAKRNTKGSGRKGKTFSSLFSGLLYCAHCGSAMYLNTRSVGTKRTLKCTGAESGICDKNRAWKYDDLEKSFLSFVREVDVAPMINGDAESKSDKIMAELNSLEGEKVATETAIGRLLELFENGGMEDDLVKGRYNKHKDTLKRIQVRDDQLRGELIEVQNSTRNAHMDFAGFPDDLETEELYNLRARVAGQIRGIVESIHLLQSEMPESPIDEYDRIRSSKPKEDQSDNRMPRRMAWWQEQKYLVRFSGGASRLIYPNKQDSSKAWTVEDISYDELMNSRYSNTLRLDIRKRGQESISVIHQL